MELFPKIATNVLSESLLPIQISPTIMLKLFVNDKFIGIHRALGDTGAHPNIIAHKLIKGEFMNSVKIRGSMIGIENQSLEIKRKIIIGLQPWYEKGENNKVNISFWILPKAGKWNPILPVRDISYAEIPKELSANLADPLFWRASPVSIVLNVGTWTSFLNGRGKKINDDLLSQESKFGNVISGQLGSNEQLELKKENYIHLIQDKSFEELNRAIQRFWEFDELSLCTKKRGRGRISRANFRRELST